MKIFLLAACWFPAAAAFCAPADISDSQTAWIAFIKGDLDKAANFWQHPASKDSMVNLALLKRDLGHIDESLALLMKEPVDDGFVLNQRGWVSTALKFYPEAREAFLKAAQRSSTSADQAEA